MAYNTEPKLKHLAQQVAAGSMRAAIKLNCIQCSGGSYSEAQRCTVLVCPLYAFRPGAFGNDTTVVPVASALNELPVVEVAETF